MEWEIFDVGNFMRKELKISVQEFCDELSISPEEESMWETNCRIPSEMLEKIRKTFKKSYNQLSLYMNVPPPVFTIEDYWQSNRGKKLELKKIANDIAEQLHQFHDDEKRLLETVETLWRKPRIVFIGGSDTGKSTLINILLGRDCLPASYSPKTSIPIYLKHMEDRPAYINDEVWIMKAGPNDEMWEEGRLTEEEYTRSYFYRGGSYSLLEEYGVFRYESGQEENQADCAVVFVDSDILRNCDLIDSPGLSSEGQIKKKSGMDYWGDFTDILIYTSTAAGFMKDLELKYLSDYMQSIPVYEKKGVNDFPKLCNLYVLATRAAEVKEDSERQLGVIKYSFMERFTRVIDETTFLAARSLQSGHSYEKEDMANRLFFFDRDIADFHTAFYRDLTSFLNKFSYFIDCYSSGAVDAVAESILNQQKQDLNQWTAIFNRKEKDYKELKKQLQTEPAYEIGRKNLKEKICKEVREHTDAFSCNIRNMYEEYFTVENIRNIWREKSFDTTQEGIHDLFTYMLSAFSETVTERMRSDIEVFSDKCVKSFDSLYGRRKKEVSTESKTQGIDYLMVAREIQKEEKDLGVPIFRNLSVGIIMTGIKNISITSPVVFVSTAIIALVVDFLQNYYMRKRVAERFIALLKEKNYMETIRKEAEKNWNNVGRNLENMGEACHKQVLSCQQKIREAIFVCESDRKQAAERMEGLKKVCMEIECFREQARRGGYAKV